ncbi:MAG: hypothetical protein JWQ98_3204 [Chlorobi bacterium]|nr:hypothetical protein [Chlorobiota bacterium]
MCRKRSGGRGDSKNRPDTTYESPYFARTNIRVLVHVPETIRQ